MTAPERRRVKLIRVVTDDDAPLACLAMLAGRYGSHVLVDEVREHVTGYEPAAVVLAAAELGLAAEETDTQGLLTAAAEEDAGEEPGFEFGDEDVARPRPAPALAALRDGSWAVLESGRDGHRWTLTDPVRGRSRLAATDLPGRLAGAELLLRVSPAENFAEIAAHRPSAWRSLGRQVAATPRLRRTLLVVFGLSLLLAALGATTPLLTKVVVDDIVPRRLDSVVPALAIGLGLVVAHRFVIELLRYRLLAIAQARVDRQLMTGFFAHLMTLPYRYFQRRQSGDLVQRLSSNAEIRAAVSQQSVSGALDGILVVGYAVALMVVSPVFAGVALGLGALQIGVLAVPARKVTRLTVAQLHEVGHTQSFAVEALSGISYLKASGSEERALRTYVGRLRRQLDAGVRLNRFTALLSAAATTVGSASSLILLFVGTLLVLHDGVSLGTMFALISLSSGFLNPLTTLIIAVQQLQSVQGHVERLASVLAAPPERDDRRRRPVGRLAGRLELRGVSYRYDRAGRDAVHDVDLVVEPGTRVALVGRSGSGKSTLAKLLLGLYEPTGGEVLVDGHNLRDLQLESVRRQFGVVLQEPALFSGSVRDNIAFNDPDLSLDAVRRAATAAGLAEDIEAMPFGYDTPVGEAGAALSGGQQQRLSLARALAHDPAVLLLDEATSNLDVTTESLVTAALRDLGCTTLVIAHRLSTVRDADRIVVMAGGTAVEQGSHAELLRAGGPYADLVRDAEGTPAVEPALVDDGRPAPPTLLADPVPAGPAAPTGATGGAGAGRPDRTAAHPGSARPADGAERPVARVLALSRDDPEDPATGI